MQTEYRVRCLKSLFVLFLVCVLGISYSFIYAQPADQTNRLADDVEVKKFAEGIWLHTTYYDIDGFQNVPANGLIVIDGPDAMLIDLPWTDEQTGVLFDWVVKEHKASIKRVIPTHSHIDSAGGLAEAHRRKADSFAFDKTVERFLILEEKDDLVVLHPSTNVGSPRKHFHVRTFTARLFHNHACARARSEKKGKFSSIKHGVAVALLKERLASRALCSQHPNAFCRVLVDLSAKPWIHAVP